MTQTIFHEHQSDNDAGRDGEPLNWFFNSPRALLRAQQWLQKHGLKKSHAATLCNILARWRREPNKPISLSDCERLYGISRRTAGKILEVIAVEGGYHVIRVFKKNGADCGFIMRRRTASDGKSSDECDLDCMGGNLGHTGVRPEQQEGENCDSPTRTSYKNQDQDFHSKHEEGGPTGPPVTRFHWTENEELMLSEAISIFQDWQEYYDGEYHLPGDSRQVLFDAAKRYNDMHLRGEIDESLEDRLAHALNRAEAHSWSYDRPHPHPVGKHFFIHLQPESLPELQSSYNVYYKDANASESRHPELRWFPKARKWLATGDQYVWGTFEKAPSSPFLD